MTAVELNEAPLAHYARIEFGLFFEVGSFMEPIRGTLNGYLVAEHDGDPVGGVGWKPDPFGVPDVVWLIWGYLHPAKQRRGIGTVLFDELERHLAGLGARKFYLDVGNEKEKAGAVNFCEKRGYVREGVLKDYWRAGEDFTIYAKELRPA
ncbi:GNAT family N-acetyltransferase [Krasilnikovia sp. M28-CT-15]|uniref:GNAT family N-acetyltransferase n=1 Tax=Krasilnikovia sp. M28-CT-15 TaxID=3373540 RepID=UPI0038762B4E